MSFFGTNKIIGIDIGNSLIKAAEIDVSKKMATLVSFSMVQTPEGSIHLGEVINPEALGQAIGEAIAQLKTKRKNLSMGIWGSAVFVKRIPGVPVVDPKVLDGQIRFEAEQVNPFGSMDGVNFDYHVLKRAGVTAEGNSVLVVIAQKDFIFKYAEVANYAGQTCSVIDVAGFALANCYEFNYGVVKDESVALLNIGFEVSNFVVVQSGEVMMAKDLPVGGVNYANEIARTMGITLPEAEALKLAACSGQSSPPEVLEVMNATHEMVIDSVRSAIDFYSQTGGEAPIRRIILSGGSRGIPGLGQRLSESLSIPFESLNPFLRIKPGKSISPAYMAQVAPYAGIVVGLALRKMRDR